MKLAVIGKDVVAANTPTALLQNVGPLDPGTQAISAFIVSGVTATATTNLTIDTFTAAAWAAAALAAGHIMFNASTGQWMCGTALAAGDMIIAAVIPVGELVHAS